MRKQLTDGGRCFCRYLLTMKLFSSRVESDADDIMFLYRQLGFTTVAEGVGLVEPVYRGRPVAAKVQFLLEEIVEMLHGQYHRNEGRETDLCTPRPVPVRSTLGLSQADRACDSRTA